MILWIDLTKIKLIFVLLFAIEMAVLSVFWQKKGLGPFGVKKIYNVFVLF